MSLRLLYKFRTIFPDVETNYPGRDFFRERMWRGQLFASSLEDVLSKPRPPRLGISWRRILGLASRTPPPWVLNRAPPRRSGPERIDYIAIPSG